MSEKITRENRKFKFETLQLHVGQETPDPVTDARAVPIYQTSSYVFRNCDHAAARFGLADAGNIYGRLTNPTEDVFEKRIAALEGGVAALAVASGAAAISYTIENLAQNGDHIVSAKNIYGGSFNLLEHTLPQYGITTTFVDIFDLDAVEAAIQDNTKAVYIETLGNPNSDVVDIEAIAKIAHAHKIPLVVDNTFATPYLVRPIEYGADIVVHSATKFIGGHGTTIGGVIVDSGKFSWDNKRYPGFAEYQKYGEFAYVAKLRNGIWRNMGGCLAPMNAFLNFIGMDTLGLRMDKICSNALELAKAVDGLNGVTANYPALENNPYKPLVESQLNGMGGGILTLRVGSKERAYQLMSHLKYALNATNIGDARTLVIHPASTIYIHNTEEQMRDAGVYADTIRVSVGIEDGSDLIEDFTSAIKDLD